MVHPSRIRTVLLTLMVLLALVASARAQANGKPAGTPISDVAKARELVEQGFTLIDFGNDLRMLSTAASDALAGMKA